MPESTNNAHPDAPAIGSGPVFGIGLDGATFDLLLPWFREGRLPTLSMIWHDAPDDEHPPANVTLGHNAVWQAVDAVTAAGLWNSTVFLLTFDDWGGYDDHIHTPNVETDLGGIQLAHGPRVPLLMFGSGSCHQRRLARCEMVG